MGAYPNFVRVRIMGAYPNFQSIIMHYSNKTSTSPQIDIEIVHFYLSTRNN